MPLYKSKPGPNWIITVEGVGQFGTSSLRKRDWITLRRIGASIEYRPVVLSVADIVKVVASRRKAAEADNLLF